MADKSGTTVRLGPATRENLKKVSYVLKKSQSLIVEEALKDYFDKHGLTGVYQLNLTKTNAVLLKVGDTPRIVDVTTRNGLSSYKLKEQYEAKLKEPVLLVVQEDE